MLSVRGQGADWKNFFFAATINGLIEEICVDVGKGRILTSAFMEGGRHIWALTQSWLFEVKGSGSFVVIKDDAFKGLRMLNPNVSYIGTIDERENKLDLKGDDGSYSKFKLGDLKTHVNPMMEKESSYLQPIPEMNGKRYVCKISPPKLNEIPIPVPDIPGCEYKQQFGLKIEEVKEMLRRANLIGCTDIQFSTTPERPEKFSYYINGEDDEIENFSHIAMNPGKALISFKAKYQTMYLEDIAAVSPSVLYIATSKDLTPSGTNPLWLGFRLPNKEMPDNRATICCYLLGNT